MNLPNLGFLLLEPIPPDRRPWALFSRRDYGQQHSSLANLLLKEYLQPVCLLDASYAVPRNFCPRCSRSKIKDKVLRHRGHYKVLIYLLTPRCWLGFINGLRKMKKRLRIDERNWPLRVRYIRERGHWLPSQVSKHAKAPLTGDHGPPPVHSIAQEQSTSSTCTLRSLLSTARFFSPQVQLRRPIPQIIRRQPEHSNREKTTKRRIEIAVRPNCRPRWKFWERINKRPIRVAKRNTARYTI